MQPILKEPLLHFAVLGIGLFALYRFVAGDAPAGPDEIVVDAPRLAMLAEGFSRSWRRPPTAAELDGLVESYIREEILYREGLALGLGRDDSVIRNRVRVKMELIGDNAESEISNADVQAWFDANADRYATPARYDLEQIYFDPAKHGSTLSGNIAAALREIERNAQVDAVQLGDATLLPAELVDVSRTDIASQFGDEIAAALTQTPTGRWFGPVSSSYGEHLLRVDVREESRPGVLADVREDVERDLRYARAQSARDALYARLRDRYTIRVEPRDVAIGAALASQSR